MPEYVTAMRFHLAILFLRYGADPLATLPRFLTWKEKTVSEVIRTLSRMPGPQSDNNPQSLEEVLDKEITHVKSRDINRKRTRCNSGEPQKRYRYDC